MRGETATASASILPSGLREFPEIGDYAVIGNCHSAALVSRAGSIEWLCLPHFSGDSVFAAVLDRERGGLFAVQPTEPYSVTRRYVGETAVLQTEFHTARGVLRLTDCMPVLCGKRWHEELQPEHETLRIVECIAGEVEVLVCYQPRPGFARRPVPLARRGRFGWHWQLHGDAAMLHADIELQPLPDRTGLTAYTLLRAGERRYLSFCYSHSEICVVPPLGREADERLAATLRWWQAWTGRCRYEGSYRAQVVRGLITLKLMTYSLSGAVVAAPTTSLPEAIGGVRNWDYRFCWLRDTSLVLQCFIDLGYDEEASAFLGWFLHATRLTWPRLQVLYDVYGETRIRERSLSHLRGYRDSRPVRTGNEALRQRQLDIYGEVIYAGWDFVDRGGALEDYEKKRLVGLGDQVCRCWRLPDNGIWETRTAPRHYTYSKVMCWAALHALTKMSERIPLDVSKQKLGYHRNEIRADIESRAFDTELNSYVGYYNGKAPDASLLLMARYEYKHAQDPRMLGTYHYIERELWHDGMLYRYPPTADYDGVPGSENPFGACSFWMIDYLARLGRVDLAAQRFEKLLGFANDVGLYGEEFDRETKKPRGNFPQAFTHVGLIAAALALHQAFEGKRGKEIAR